MSHPGRDHSPSSPAPPPSADITPDDTLQFLLRTATLPLLSSPSSTDPMDDDLAATTLVQRLGARRQREREHDLEWDERDNARRARELLDRLFPNEQARWERDHAPWEGFTGSDSDDSDDDVPMHDSADSDARPSLANLFRAMAGPPGLADDGTNEEDERILGFDGDELIGEYYDEDFLEQPREETDPSIIWPGFLGQRPLNPPPTRRSRPTEPPAVSTARPIRSLPRDPSCSLSYTSYFEPGVVFLGQQAFGRAEQEAASWLRRHPTGASASSAAAPSSSSSSSSSSSTTPRPPRSGALTNFLLSHTSAASSDWLADPSRQSPSSLSSDEQHTTAHPAFSPFPSATPTRVVPPDVGPSSSLSIPRPSASPSSLSTRYAPYAQPPPPSSVSPSWLSVPAPRSSEGTTPVPTGQPASLSAAARARSRVAQQANPLARSSRSSWREVEEEMLAHAVARERGGPPPVIAAPTRRKEETREQEQWAVKVVMQSYSPSSKSLSGLMRAHGVAAPHPPSASSSSYDSSPPRLVPTDVLTHFTGHIIDPLEDGLFSSLITSPGLETFRVSRQSEAESWIQLGPFTGLTKEELLARGKSREWLEERTRGWVLFRLKERGFVNVTEKESSLSIAGHYCCLLSRETGEIEGLYSDPTATPFQRLSLSAHNETTGAFSLGTFSMR